MSKPKFVQRERHAARAEQRRYEAWLAKHACEPVPVYHDPFVARHAVDPDGVVAVLYYSMGKAVSPTHCFWIANPEGA